VHALEARPGPQVEVTIVGSDEVLRAKLADSRGPGYDAVAANTVELAALLARDELAPLTLADLPQVARQLPRFRGPIEGIVRNGKTYAVPYTYSEMGLVYDRQQFSAPPQSLSVLWDPRWRGKVLAFDGATHAFSLAALEIARDLAPGIPRGVLYEDVPADWHAELRRLGAISLHCDAERVSDAVLAEAAEAGVPVLCYTVNSENQAKILVDRGVSAMFTDRLDRFAGETTAYKALHLPG